MKKNKSMNKIAIIFEELSSKDVDIAGGKGASLGEMTQAGIPVPPGFVILSSTFDQFIKGADLVQEIDAILDKVNHKEIHTVENASEKIQSLIKNAIIPENIAKEIKKEFENLNTEFVAVRSSATAEDGAENAWAGQLDSFLNTKKEDLLEKVLHCWASLFTPRAIFYRFEKGLHTTTISVAVVIQKMVNSEISGIAFSVHPVTEDRNQIIIEAGFGLGEAIVSGSVTPDSYVVEKEPRRIIDINVNNQNKALYRKDGGGNIWKDLSKEEAEKQVLSEEQILEFSEIILRIENHYGFPCDIEWAFEKGEFYIVQSRPITTLNREEDINQDNKSYLINKAKKLDWKHWLERPYGPFITTLDFAGVENRYFEKVGLPNFGYNANLYQYPNLYYSEKDAENNKKVLTDYLKNKKSIFDISKALEITHKKNIKEINTIINSKLDIIEKLLKVREITRTYFPFLWIIIPLEEYYNKKINEEIPKYIKGDPQKFVGDVSIPDKKNAYGKMLEALGSGIPIKKVHEKFAWIKSRDGFTDFYTIQELEEIKSNSKKEENHKIQIPKNLEELVSDLKELNFFRTTRTDNYYEMLGLARPILKEVAEYLNIAFGELADYDTDSIIKGSPIKINKPYNFLFIENKQFIQYEPIILISKVLETEIKGTPAFKGIVRGHVKIVTHPNDVQKVNSGDILVTQMTLPSFISAMQKASGFVTDEGGITCHAAIIAREMNKPCIIGTKNGTKILKDGDFVEVDANNGVVKIIVK